MYSNKIHDLLISPPFFSCITATKLHILFSSKRFYWSTTIRIVTFCDITEHNSNVRYFHHCANEQHTETCENKGHVLTDTSNGTRTSSQTWTDATNVVAHYGGMFHYFKGTFCLIHFANTHIWTKTSKVKVTCKAAGYLGRFAALVYWSCFSLMCTVQEEQQINK